MGKKEKNTLYVSIGLRLREYRTTYLKITQEKMAEILVYCIIHFQHNDDE